MKNNVVKEIITEAVLGFLNEVRQERPEDRKKIDVKPHIDTSFDVGVKNKDIGKKVKIHPAFHKPDAQLTQPGVNEEELPDSGSLFDESIRKKFLKAIQTKDR